jgi:arylsulfatase A-like enzyme
LKRGNDIDPQRAVGLGLVFSGAWIFCLFQYCLALAKLGQSSSAMENKFSALARDKYMGFLIWQNVQVLIAYVVLAVVFALVLQPFVSRLCRRFAIRKKRWRLLAVVAGAFLIHSYFTLRLVDTRPYFLGDAKFGYWYYEILNAVPQAIKPSVFFTLFRILPITVAAYAMLWHWSRLPGKWRWSPVAPASAIMGILFWKSDGFPPPEKDSTADQASPNVIIIGSDSLRSDRLGCNGYQPRRTDGLAAAGVSPRIDALAKRSANLTNCFTPIASTLESGTSLMSSQYPHTHGLRQMYPDEETVNATKAEIDPLPRILAEKGYDTAAFGDWCAGYYELMPMGFEHISVSSFDNFKIYISQAVVMAHFVIPLYFDHPAGYAIFPQLGSFANFVTPEVVTGRVKGRMAGVAESGKPFFWHVFYSCNHLPYRSPAPYSTMFADPTYSGPNRNGVDFDIDSFIGGTDLENKWKALPEKEIRQIRDLYDGCTRQFDDNVGEILDALKANGLDKNTIVLITADHGDNLYEEGVTLGHGLTFNGGMRANHVPLVFHLPGAEPREISAHVRTIDIAPTIADLLGAEKPGSWEGQSFARWLDGTEQPSSRAYYGETGFPFVQFRVPGIVRPKLPPMDGMTGIDDTFNYQFVLKKEWQAPLVAAKQRCLMTDDWKLICTPAADGSRHFALFSRSPDAYSEMDVSAENPKILAKMKVALEKWMDEKVETPVEGIK